MGTYPRLPCSTLPLPPQHSSPTPPIPSPAATNPCPPLLPPTLLPYAMADHIRGHSSVPVHRDDKIQDVTFSVLTTFKPHLIVYKPRLLYWGQTSPLKPSNLWVGVLRALVAPTQTSKLS